MVKIKKSEFKGLTTKEKISKLKEKVLSGDLKVLKKKVLTKPKGSIVQPVSSSKVLKSFAQSSEPLVREAEPKEVVQDNRSQFFKQEFINEERSNNKWFR